MVDLFQAFPSVLKGLCVAIVMILALAAMIVIPAIILETRAERRAWRKSGMPTDDPSHPEYCADIFGAPEGSTGKGER